MVKKIALFFIYFLFFLLAVVYFAPKEGLYYLLEQKLKPYGVVVSDEKIRENGFTLRLEDADIYVQSIESAKISSIDTSLFLLFNRMKIKDVRLNDISAAFMPTKIEEISVNHSIVNPLVLHVKAYGDFGEIDGKINLLGKQVRAVLKPSGIMLQKYQNTLRLFVKDQKGEYIYEKNI
ncbi:hypothetical protein KKA17_03045 [bacterium]|nr:hypothetical protein [bacterium]MBU1884852.1 hypothetical protein [bacterium]